MWLYFHVFEGLKSEVVTENYSNCLWIVKLTVCWGLNVYKDFMLELWSDPPLWHRFKYIMYAVKWCREHDIVNQSSCTSPPSTSPTFSIRRKHGVRLRGADFHLGSVTLMLQPTPVHTELTVQWNQMDDIIQRVAAAWREGLQISVGLIHEWW